MDFGTILKQLRTEKELTQTDIANILNTTKATISRYEANLVEPNLETIYRLSDYFEVTTDFLLGKSILKRPEERIAFHLEDDELDSEDIALIKNLYETLKKKHKK